MGYTFLCGKPIVNSVRVIKLGSLPLTTRPARRHAYKRCLTLCETKGMNK